jgi:hypothetical protein
MSDLELPRGPLTEHLKSLGAIFDLIDQQTSFHNENARVAFGHHLRCIAIYTKEDPYGSPLSRPPLDVIMEREGLAKRYYLVGHPAWPDPLLIWPPTLENALAYKEKYVDPPREDGRTPRIMWRWEHTTMKELGEEH